MEEIEERATKYADLAKKQTFFDDRVKDVAADFAYKHYIIGANEQLKRDIDFVRFWLCDNVAGTTLISYDIDKLCKEIGK